MSRTNRVFSCDRIAGLVLAGLLVSACAHRDDTQATHYVKPAEDQSYGAAVEHFREAHDQTPEDLNALLGLSRNLRYSGQANEAVIVLDKSRHTFGGDATYLAELGKANLVAGKADDARDALNRSLQQGGRDWQTFSALGVANDLKQSYPQAREAYDQALRMCPDSAPILNNKALSVAATGDIDEAIRLMRQSYGLEPRSHRIASNLASLQTLRANCAQCSTSKLQQLARSIYPLDWAVSGDGLACDPNHLMAGEIVKAINEKDFVDLHVNFAFDSAELLPPAKEALDELGRALATDQLTTFRFRLEGHTDAVGTDEYNLGLSKRRATAVKTYLVGSLGLKAARLDVEGFGESRLLDPKQPNSGVNRRVRVVKTGQDTVSPGPVSSR